VRLLCPDRGPATERSHSRPLAKTCSWDARLDDVVRRMRCSICGKRSNLGLSIVMIENYRSNLVWDTMRRDPTIRRGLKRAGFSGGWLGSTG
jgi:hypothetical protein